MELGRSNLKSLDLNLRLNKKLVDLLRHIENLKASKKDDASRWAEQIKEASKKVKSITDAIQSNDETYLTQGFSHEEVKLLLRD